MTNNKQLDDLLTFLRIPSISALPEHKDDILKAASFLENQLKQIGFTKSKQIWAKGCEYMPPIVYTERTDKPENPTVLVYNHYDVQPVDPPDEWKKPPFEPVIENGNIYARGATDDKGQLMTHIATLSELSQEWSDTWPVNIKIVYEGQEESGGENLHAWLQEKDAQELLKADIAIVSDTEFYDHKTPAITYGLRGIVYIQIDITLADHDLHSGSFGGSVLNPINALVSILSELYDAQTGKILIPGFYDDVTVLDQEEKKLIEDMPIEESQHLKDAGNAQALFGEQGYSNKERLTVRPTLDINGIWGGFSGEGAKTIIPASAHAKFSCRLVPFQQAEKIAGQIQSYIEQLLPKEVKSKVTCIHTGESVLIDKNSPWMKIAQEALKETFGLDPVFGREGGSIPVVADFKKYLGIETILLGYGFPDDNHHAPNEKFSLKQFELGIECNKRFYKKCAEISVRR